MLHTMPLLLSSPTVFFYLAPTPPSSPLPSPLPSPSSSSSSSSSALPLSSSQSPLSRLSPRIPKLASQPRNAIPPKTPHAKASPRGLTCVAREKSPPERKGPAARPAAERVCARPLRVPRTEWLGAELVICDHVSAFYEV